MLAMTIRTLIVCSSLLAAACQTPSQPTSPTSQRPAPLLPNVDFARDLPVRACFEIRDPGNGAVMKNDATLCATPRRPYSTFKIANALVGLESGLLTDATTLMPWDETLIPPNPAWPIAFPHGPITLQEAIRLSSVPHFRTLAAHLGPERMRAGLATLGYGNQNIDGGLTTFWLSGGLRISADQQLEFIDHLAHTQLPVSARAQATMQQVLHVSDSGQAARFGKTGTGEVESEDGKPVDASTPHLAWFVGWVQKRGAIYPFALWIEAPGFDQARALRQKTLDAVLGDLGLAH
jgi:beta-lactamase class D